MLKLPPLLPVTDAGLDLSLAEQVRRLGVAGFPLVQFKGEPLDGEVQWEELRAALAASWENGGWPAIFLSEGTELALRASQERRPPWGLQLGRTDRFPAEARCAPGLAIGTTTHRLADWSSLDPGWELAAVGPFRATGEAVRPIGLEGLRKGCALLRQKGLTPFAFGGLNLEDGADCFQAGAEALALGREILGSPKPAELLWQAQRLRWRFRPPLQKGQGVALIGGSGCGKSTLARRLGDLLHLPMQDLDETIVQRAGKPISRIFAEQGESAFRTLETELTCEAFQDPAVLALGGGAWESETIRSAARASGFVVLWIAENPDRIWRRVAQDPVRPLAQEQELFLTRWRTRMPRWMEAPMILPLGRGPGRLARALQESSGS